MLVYKEKIHKRAVCVVKEGKGKGIVVVGDLEGEAPERDWSWFAMAQLVFAIWNSVCVLF